MGSRLVLNGPGFCPSSQEHGAVAEGDGHWCRKETTKMNQKRSRLISNGL